MGSTETCTGYDLPREKLDMKLEGKKVLIIDDVIQSGHSLIKVIKYVKNKNPSNTYCAVVLDGSALSLLLELEKEGLTFTDSKNAKVKEILEVEE